MKALAVDGPIIFCNGRFCQMVGYTRAKTMQKPAVTKLLHRPLTWAESSNQVREVLSIVEKRQIDILYYEEDGKYRNYSLTRSSLFFGSFRYSCSRTATTSMLTFLAAFSSRLLHVPDEFDPHLVKLKRLMLVFQTTSFRSRSAPFCFLFFVLTIGLASCSCFNPL